MCVYTHIYIYVYLFIYIYTIYIYIYMYYICNSSGFAKALDPCTRKSDLQRPVALSRQPKARSPKP